MTTATTHVTNGTILTLDLGKYKTVACVYDRATTSRHELRQRCWQHRPPHCLAGENKMRAGKKDLEVRSPGGQ